MREVPMHNRGYVLIAAGGIILAGAAIAFGVWAVAQNAGAVISTGFDPKDLSEDTREISAATSLDAEGLWDIRIVGGKPSLRFKATKEQLKNIRFDQQGGTLSLRQEGMNIGRPIKVELSLADLDELSLKGAGSVAIDGFKVKDLRISLEGGASLVMVGSTVENLDLRSEGACNVDLGDTKTINASVHLSGASNAILDMDGGSLGGKIEGVGHLSYSGVVSGETIQTDGLATVDKK
jgi:hypothetical protein